MDYEAFCKKLSPFFTPKQIENLNDYALESALDAHEGDDIRADTDLMQFIGRDFVCSLLWDMTADDDPCESISAIAGGTFTPEQFAALDAQMDIDW